MVVLGSMSLGGNIIPVENIAETLQVAFDAGAKRILLPMVSVKDIPTIPGELFAKFQTSFYSDAADAVCRAVRLLVPATSLGGVETTIERRQKYAGDAHVPPGLLRMSVGVEHLDDLWYDLVAALDRH